MQSRVLIAPFHVFEQCDCLLLALDLCSPQVPEHFLSTKAELLEFHWRIKLILPFIKANSPTQSQTIVQNIRCEHVQQGSGLGRAK